MQTDSRIALQSMQLTEILRADRLKLRCVRRRSSPVSDLLSQSHCSYRICAAGQLCRCHALPSRLQCRHLKWRRLLHRLQLVFLRRRSVDETYFNASSHQLIELCSCHTHACMVWIELLFSAVKMIGVPIVGTLEKPGCSSGLTLQQHIFKPSVRHARQTTAPSLHACSLAGNAL